MEIPTEFFLSYAWNPAAWPAERLPEYLKLWATREFGASPSADIADLVERYTQFNGRRKPEQLSPDTYSAVNYREAERIMADYDSLYRRATEVAKQLPAEYQDAFFELVQYPVQATAVVNDLYVTVARNRIHAAQGRADTNELAQRARKLFGLDAELARQYNHDVAGGKWDHMMSQTHIGYKSWNEPKTNVMPEVSEISLGDHAEMGVAVEASQNVWPNVDGLRLPAFDPFSNAPHYIDIFNRGKQSFSFTASADAPWVVLSQTTGTVGLAQRITVSVRWDQVPKGATAAQVLVTGPDGAIAHVTVPLAHADMRGAALSGFIESGGVVAIEAEHYARALAPRGREWLRIPGFGRTLSGVTALPVDAKPAGLSDGLRLEYDVYLFKAGKVQVQATLAPTLKFLPGSGFRYAVSFDDEPPKIVDVHADTSLRHWEKTVSDGVTQLISEHELAAPGRHTLKFWALNSGLVLERLVIDAGGLLPSYLGPPESLRLP